MGFYQQKPLYGGCPHIFYEPWERVMDQLPLLLEAGCVRECVDALPVLGTFHLNNDQELQRAYSMLAMIAQAIHMARPETVRGRLPCASTIRLVRKS